MSDKYVVSQEFMDDLEEWKKLSQLDKVFLSTLDINRYSDKIYSWWLGEGTHQEQNNRLIAIIRWVNGEDVFEIEKPKKWIVRSKWRDDDDNYGYVDLIDNAYAAITNIRLSATRFDTKEEATSWANSHQEVVEVER